MAYQPKSYRKFVATAATATLVATAFAPFASAHSFNDVEEKYNEAVDFLVSKGVTGYTDGTFKTQQTITRLEAAEMLGKALGLTEVKDAPASGFTDVPARVATLINAFKAEGITTGKTETTFGSNDEITRGELAIWLQRAYELEAKDGSTNDFTDVADRYKAAVQALVDNEITQGTTETTFGTTANAKRGDFALFVKRAADAATPVVVAPEIVSVSAINAKTVAVTFNTDVTKADLKAADFKVTNLAVTNVSVSGKVATLTLSSELSNGTTYTVDFEKEGSEKSSANFLYAVVLEKGIKLTETNFTRYANQANPNIFDFVTVADANGKVIPASQIASKHIETDVATVVATTAGTGVKVGDLLSPGTAKVNVKYTLADGTILETGNIQIQVTNQDAKNSAGFNVKTADYNNTVEFKLNQAANNHKTILYPEQGNGAFVQVYGFDANNDPLTEKLTSSNGEKVSYNVTSGDTLFQVHKDSGAVIYQAKTEGKATVQVKKGSFSYDAQVELRNYAKLSKVTTTTSGLTIAESKNAPAEQTDASRKTASLALTLLDQYNTAFGAAVNNKVNGTEITVAAGTNVMNDATTPVKVGQSAEITYTSDVARKGKVVATADSNKVDVTIAAGGKVTVTPKTRDIASDETVSLQIALYDTTANSEGTLLQTITVPVTIKNITEAVAQKVVKVSDLDASNAATPDANQTTLALWEVDIDGDLIKPVTVKTSTVNRGADLTNAADDVVISTNDNVEFEAVIANSEVDRFIMADTTTYDATNVTKDNKITLTTSGPAAVTYKFNAPTPGDEATLFGYDEKFTVKAKTGNTSATTGVVNYITAQTVDVRAYNSKDIAEAATIKSTNTVDISDTLLIKGGSTITIEDAILGLYDKSEFIVDVISTKETTIALKNGQDGAVVSPVVSLTSQNNKAVAIGPKAYGEEVTANFAFDKSKAVNGGTQTLVFAGTLVDTNNITVTGKSIGDAISGTEEITLATDKEEGSIKVLLTSVTRSNDFAAPYSKNLLKQSQIVTIKFTK